MKALFFHLCCIAFCLCFVSCHDDAPSPIPEEKIYTIPLVVHVLHHGEPVGVGSNLSRKRIERQIEILNEDFRRKAGTRGFNDHPDGADARIEFVLARQTPNGSSSDGIVRIDTFSYNLPNASHSVNYYAQFSYWPPDQYVNIWTIPLPEELACMVLGQATAPATDLPGTHLTALPAPGDAEGIAINWSHFGESDIDCHARLGRTLTHEMGHYLGLLHPWGGRDCETNDYCDDTPAVDDFVWGAEAYEGCTGEMIMIGNYMNYSDDSVMNIFTKDQVGRMHYVLEHHAGRNALLSSRGLQQP